MSPIWWQGMGKFLSMKWSDRGIYWSIGLNKWWPWRDLYYYFWILSHNRDMLVLRFWKCKERKSLALKSVLVLPRWWGTLMVEVTEQVPSTCHWRILYNDVLTFWCKSIIFWLSIGDNRIGGCTQLICKFVYSMCTYYYKWVVV